MRTITNLSLQRNGKRVNVFLDGEYAFSLARMIAVDLRIGQSIEEDRILSLQETDSLELGKQIAFRLLSYRPRSISEVERHLSNKQLSDTMIKRVVEKLCDLDLLNDRTFADYWIDQRKTFRPRSKRALRHELLQKGINLSIIEESLATVDELDAAMRVAQKKARSYKNLPPEAFSNKLGRFLSGRGFDYNVISTVVKSITESHHDG